MPKAELSHFLRGIGLTLEDVEAAVSPEFPDHREGLFLACGSTVEGLGNSRSDLDICLISDIAPPGVAAETNRVITIGALLCDVLFVHPDTIAALVAKLVDLTGESRNFRRTAKVMGLIEERLLHRLHHAVPLAMSPDSARRHTDLLARLPLERLARVKLDRARYEAMALQLDLAGLWDAGEWRSMIFATQDLLARTIDALLAGNHISNPTPKWRATLIGRLPSARALGIPGIFDDDISETVTRLHGCLNPSPATARRYALEVAAFARVAFAWAEQRLLGGIALMRSALPAEKARPYDDCLPALDLDVCMRRVGDAFEIYRLNRIDQRILVDASSASLLCYFDGNTSIEWASRAAVDILPGKQSTLELNRLMALVGHARLAAHSSSAEEILEVLAGAAEA